MIGQGLDSSNWQPDDDCGIVCVLRTYFRLFVSLRVAVKSYRGGASGVSTSGRRAAARSQLPPSAGEPAAEDEPVSPDPGSAYRQVKLQPTITHTKLASNRSDAFWKHFRIFRPQDVYL